MNWFVDITERSIKDLSIVKAIQLYTAGWPCTGFSWAGLREGLLDSRSFLIHFVISTIAALVPKMLLLENHDALAENQQFLETFIWLIDALKSIHSGCYEVRWAVINVVQHGIPQNRRRLYILGFLDTSIQINHKFVWPQSSQCPLTCSDLLGPRTRTPTLSDLPPASAGTARGHVISLLEQCVDSQIDPFETCICADTDGTNINFRPDGILPCFTKAHYQGPWITNKGCRMSLKELYRFFGMKRSLVNVPSTVSTPQMNQMLGNSIGVNVLERLFKVALPHVGLATADLPSHWESPAEVLATVRGGFLR